MSINALDSAYAEYALIKCIEHENIVRSKGYYEDNDYIIIVFELMSSDLRSILEDVEEPMDELYIKTIFRQMLFAIENCHR